jgi:hypothetical protein
MRILILSGSIAVYMFEKTGLPVIFANRISVTMK